MKKNRIKIRKAFPSLARVTKCQECGKEAKLMAHHIRALSKGGNNSKGNILMVCHECHKRLDSEALGTFDYLISK